MLVHDHASDIASLDEIVNGDVDIVDAIARRDQLIELEVPGAVEGVVGV